MKKAFMGLWALVCLVSLAYAERPIEELPMFDGKYTPEVSANKENSQSAAKQGWDYYYKGDIDTAMKRFNQAWMFDQDSVDALWGFGVIMGQRAAVEDTEHNLREAVRFLEMAKTKAGTNNRILVDLGISDSGLGSFMQNEGRSEEAGKYFQQAREIFEQAEKIEPKYPLLQYSWSLLEYYEGNYPAAKTRLEKFKGLGYTPNPAYEEELSIKLKLR